MFKAKLCNKIITRKLLTADSAHMLSKPKPRDFDDVINHHFYCESVPITKKMDLNSRFIAVEGCFGVHKEKIARKIAKHFGMYYSDDIHEDEIYMFRFNNLAIDLSMYNQLLPRTAKIYTCKLFWNDDDPIGKGKPMLLQLHQYYHRYFNICKAMAYLFATGIGFVSKRSPHSDYAMALALRNSGLMSPAAFKMFNLFRVESIPNLWRPNFIVYIKATPEIIRENLKKKNSYLLNARNFTDEYIINYHKAMENVFIKEAELFSRVFTIDLSTDDIDDDDWFAFFAAKLAASNVILDELDIHGYLFRDWRIGTSTTPQLIYNRSHFSDAQRSFIRSQMYYKIPMALTEGAYSNDDLHAQFDIISQDDRSSTFAPFNPKYASWKDILFPVEKVTNFSKLKNTPMELIFHSLK